MSSRIGILLLLAVVLTAAFSLFMAQPPAVVSARAADTVFSAGRAYGTLKQLARAPHPTGSAENARVRSFIETTCKALGLATTVQNGTAVGSFRSSSTLFAGNVYNVVARLKGRNTNPARKSVLVMAHYDSQPNTPAAGDDGAAVAAMLETIRILKQSSPLENDVLFLFTDGEEIGLTGARVFLEESGLSGEIGLVLNFEARGSGGLSNMFEVNSDNGWVVRQFARAAAHPFANSLSFEVYKLLPNDTDFTLFKQAGVTGLNHAFIEHLEDYHSATDKPGHLDKRSLQHHGANMLSLVKHFGNSSLEHTKAADITYFNVLGSWLVYYPAVLNTVLVVVVSLLYLFLLTMAIRQRRLWVKAFGAGVLLFLGLVIAVVVAVWLVQKALLTAYPLNTRFYENNAYNSYWYFLAFTALVVGLFGQVYQWAVRRGSMLSLFAGALLVLVVLMILLHLFMPTATYLFGFPLLGAIAGSLVLVYSKESTEPRSWRSGLTLFSCALPALLLFPPVIFSVYVAFGLGALLPGAPVLVGILCVLLLPLFAPVFKSHRLLVPVAALVVFLAALLAAHLQSGFTPTRPLPSNLWYLLDADKKEARWVSDHTTTDPFNSRFFTNPQVQAGLSGSRPALVQAAPPMALAPPTVSLVKDGPANGNRALQLQCRSLRGAISMTVAVHTRAPIQRLLIDGRPAALPEGAYSSTGISHFEVQYHGLTPRGMELWIEIQGRALVNVTVTDRSLGLPGVSAYPPGIIPGVGRNSNTTQVKKSYQF